MKKRIVTALVCLALLLMTVSLAAVILLLQKRKAF